MTDDRVQRQCPTCRTRFFVPPTPINPNFTTLPIDRTLYHQLRQAAESFDRAASSAPDEEYSSGTGDGTSRFTAAEFIAWLKPDCAGFRDTPILYDTDGASPRSENTGKAGGGTYSTVHRHPDPVPYYKRPRRTA